MISIFNRHAAHVRLLCFLCWLLPIPVTHAAIDVLDRVDITHGAGESTLHIHFNIPVTYRSHVPERSGDLLRIFVEPLPTPGSGLDALLGRESIQWSPDDRVPLFDVVYEARGFGDTTLNLRFQKAVEFETPRLVDARTLDVVIKHPKTSRPGLTATPPLTEAETQPGAIPPIEAETRPDAATPIAPATLIDAEVPPPDTGTPVADTNLSFPYVINLSSSIQPVRPEILPRLELFTTYRLYTAFLNKDGKTWHRLRLGFFETRADAAAIVDELKSHYPEAWIAKASANERMKSGESMIVGTRPAAGTSGAAATELPSTIDVKPATQGELAQQPKGPVVPEERLSVMMDEGREKMTAEDYAGAIRIYTKVSQSAENQYSQDALEFLGLARERKGQLAHAKLAYEQYLARYPEGEGADRVKQRLAGLVTARKQPRDKLLTPEARTSGQASEWDVFGGISQFYRRDENTTGLDEDDELTTVNQSSLDTNVDVTGRLRHSDYDLRTRFTGGYLHDFLDNGENSDTTVSSLYFDGQNKKHDLSMRLGRQSRSSGGVLGRFDGLLLGAPLGSKFSISAVGGYPVNSSTDSVETDRYFYGLTLASSGFAPGWDANVFAIEQRVEGMIDRRAVGGELRYFDAHRSFFSLLDYDIHYNELNIGQFLGNWIFPDKTTVNIILDYRNSPILTTNNALTGQVFDSIGGLQDLFTDSEIEDLARDRTGTSKLVTLGISRPLHEKLQVSGDVTASNLSDTRASGGVEATEGSGTDFFYNVQLIGSNLIKTGDITILGLRYTDTDDRSISSLNLNTRYPITQNFRINPRFTVDYRENRDDDTDQVILRPSMRLSYQARRRLRLEAEFGGEYTDREIVEGSEKDRSYFFNLGYRADF